MVRQQNGELEREERSHIRVRIERQKSTKEGLLMAKTSSSSRDEIKSSSEKVRAAVFARAPSPDQMDEQVRQCLVQCEVKGWQAVYVFRDESVGGVGLGRAQVRNMLDKAETGTFDVIVCWSLDHVSRQLMDVIRLEEQLRGVGVALHSVADQIDIKSSAGMLSLFEDNEVRHE
jgi:hypothetical protein